MNTIEHSYTERAARFARLRDTAALRWNQVANWRLVTALAALVAASIGGWQNIPALLWLAALLASTFLALVIIHTRLAARRDYFAARYALSHEGLARCRRDWAGLPLRQPPGPPPDSPTARDLDLLGFASLQQLMGTPQSPIGLATLQDWLLTPATPATVIRRQAAAAELAPLIDLREEVAVLAGRAGKVQAHYTRFVTWAEGAPWLLQRPVLLWTTRLSPVLLLAGLAVQLAGLTPLPLWAPFLLLNMLLTALVGWRSLETLAQLSDRGELLATYADLFARIAAAPLEAVELRLIQHNLAGGGMRADQQLRRLSLIAGGAALNRSLLYPALQFGLLWSFHVVALAEGWRQVAGAHVGPWLAALGDCEALGALATLCHDHPTWQFPTVSADEPPRILARKLGHPLLPPDSCVTNDVIVGPPGSVLLITGSNMAGKSTLLRAIGVNIALAQAGGPVCADELRLPPVTLATSMRVQDSLAQGVSFFMAELRRLKAIVDCATNRQAEDALVCFILDEILHGTNSAERLVAARRVIAYLVGQGAIGVVSTHDLALATAPTLADMVQLAHVTEHVMDGPDGPEMRFDYVLRPGIATTTNALRLMAMVGLPTEEHAIEAE
ncbi:MAG: DNA mismatch repair protein MutS [Oscillochloris sp.]|nr:DNA mismatch repair protein MutS [Oscillochloris sp.]